jgi:ribosome maturation factor RimP
MAASPHTSFSKNSRPLLEKTTARRYISIKFSEAIERVGLADPLFFVTWRQGMDEIEIENRVIREAGLESRIAGIVEPVLEELGYQLVRVKLSALSGRTLQIMAERPGGTMSVEDCRIVSHALSPVLDFEDPIHEAYNLEISSPGIDRPLVRRGDFERWVGHDARVEMRNLIDGRRRFKGKLTGIGAESAVLRFQSGADADKVSVELRFADMAEARLILDDSLIRAALKRDKTLRHGAATDGGSA